MLFVMVLEFVRKVISAMPHQVILQGRRIIATADTGVLNTKVWIDEMTQGRLYLFEKEFAPL